MRGNQDVETSTIDSELSFTPGQVVPIFFRSQKIKKLELKSRKLGDTKKPAHKTRVAHKGLHYKMMQDEIEPQFHSSEP